METATFLLTIFSVTVIVYFALWNASQMAMSPIALWFLARHRVRHRRHVPPVVRCGAESRTERVRAR